MALNSSACHSNVVENRGKRAALDRAAPVNVDGRAPAGHRMLHEVCGPAYPDDDEAGTFEYADKTAAFDDREPFAHGASLRRWRGKRDRYGGHDVRWRQRFSPLRQFGTPVGEVQLWFGEALVLVDRDGEELSPLQGLDGPAFGAAVGGFAVEDGGEQVASARREAADFALIGGSALRRRAPRSKSPERMFRICAADRERIVLYESEGSTRLPRWCSRRSRIV